MTALLVGLGDMLDELPDALVQAVPRPPNPWSAVGFSNCRAGGLSAR
jgi:hypothetical protein